MTEHIQINAVAPRIVYVADGVQLAFTYPFAIFRAADIEVWLDDAALSSGYSVSGAGITAGGAVLFATPPAAGQRVTLRRRLSLARTADYQADGLIRAKTLNDEFDFQVAALQQVAEEVERTIRRSPTSASLADLTLPEPAAHRGLKWNAAGTALVNSATDPDTMGNVVQATADAMAAATTAIAARDQAMAAAGGVKVSAGDGVAAPLATKLVAGEGIALTAGAGADQRLTIAATVSVPAAIADRLDFLERNLAVNTLRDQIDTGWGVLKMVDGAADEFEDETGIATSTGATYDSIGDYYHNPGTYVGLGANIATAASAISIGVSTSGDGPLANAFDGSTSTFWRSAGNVNVWIGQDFVVAKNIRAATFNQGFSGNTGHGSTTVSLQSSDDASAWTTRATGNGLNVYQAWNTIDSSYTGSHRYWRIFAASIPVDWRVQELQMMSGIYGLSADMDLVSVAHAANFPPSEVRLLLLHQPVSMVTPNTDLIVQASRDGGTTWTAGTLVSEGAFDSTTTILSAVIDLSAQPAGSSMKWRFTTFNTKEQRLHGVWMQWR